MVNPLDQTHPARYRNTRRLRRSVAGITSVAATGVVTFPAGFLNDLQPDDIVTFDTLTGTHLAEGVEYYLSGPAGGWALGATTANVALTPGGAAVTGGSNITAGNAVTGKLTVADDGVQSGNIVGALSPLGR